MASVRSESKDPVSEGNVFEGAAIEHTSHVVSDGSIAKKPTAEPLSKAPVKPTISPENKPTIQDQFKTQLISERDKLINEFSLVVKITHKGQFLGTGAYGTGYRIGKFVFKVHHEHVPSKKTKRSADYWNLFYSQVYNKKYAHLAIAMAITLPYTNAPNENYFGRVLVTPFIPDCAVGTAHMLATDDSFIRTLRSLGLDIVDKDVQGNIKQTIDGDLLPVDFDQCFKIPERHDFFSHAYYVRRPSLSSMYFAKKEYCFLHFFPEKNKKKETDEIGLRSLFMRA